MKSETSWFNRDVYAYVLHLSSSLIIDVYMLSDDLWTKFARKGTLNSSNVKLTRQTPHHGSTGKSTGCVGSNSLAIDLFSFHIIFWISPRNHNSQGNSKTAAARTKSKKKEKYRRKQHKLTSFIVSHYYNKDQRSYVNPWNHLHKLIDIKISKIPYHAKANSSIYYSFKIQKTR